MARKRKIVPRWCDYCHKVEEEAGPFIESQADSRNRNGETLIFICLNCVERCGAKVQEMYERANNIRKFETAIPKVKEIKAVLDAQVIGQERAKRAISVAISNHFMRMIANQKENDVEIEKSNVLLIGSTGTGKTYMARILAKYLGLPFAIGDATTLTEAGYVGDDVETLLMKLLHSAEMNIQLAQRGIIFLDEVDKLAKTSGNVSITRDVSGEGVQQALLKMMENTQASVMPKGGRKHPEAETIKFETDNVLFICSGSFVGLDEIIAKRLGKKRTIGFGTSTERSEEEKNNILSKVTPEDLIEYGMIPEFVGRLPIITTTSELTEGELVSALIEPKNAILKQYQKLVGAKGIYLDYTPEAIREIAHQAYINKTGVRSLRSVVEGMMQELMYEIDDLAPGTKFLITKDVVCDKISLLDSFLKEQAA